MFPRLVQSTHLKARLDVLKLLHIHLHFHPEDCTWLLCYALI